jgi:hypothetical protein
MPQVFSDTISISEVPDDVDPLESGVPEDVDLLELEAPDNVEPSESDVDPLGSSEASVSARVVKWHSTKPRLLLSIDWKTQRR